MCFSCICLCVLYVFVFVIFSSSWCRGLAAVCDCGTPLTFLLTFFSANRSCHRRPLNNTLSGTVHFYLDNTACNIPLSATFP